MAEEVAKKVVKKPAKKSANLPAVGLGRKFDYKLVVIGSGAAGTAAALVAARNTRGKGKIAIIENGAWGGAMANLRYAMPAAEQFCNAATRKPSGVSKKICEDAGIECIRGFAHFVNQYEVAVGSRKIAAPRFILATGARVNLASVPGADLVECLTPEEAMRMTELPQVLTVVGGGSTGCEVASYFAGLGVKVILMEAAERLLPREDKEVGILMEQYFTKRLGMKVLTGAQVVKMETDVKSRKVIFATNGGEKSLRTEMVVLANGAMPVTDYGLENAKVKYAAAGIRVDRGLQTSSKHIWAAGDAIGGGESSYEKAGYEGTIAAGNAVRHAKNLINYGGFMRVTNTYPQVAKVGMNEVDCAAAKIRGVRRGIVMLGDVAASRIYGFNVGFVKILADKQGKLLGATVMAPEASLVAQEVSLALRYGMGVTELAATPHSFGWGEAIQEAIRRCLNSNRL